MKFIISHLPIFKQRLFAKFSTLKFRMMLLITLVLLIVVGGPLYFLVYQLDKNYHEFSINMIETTSQAVYQSVFEGFLQNDRESIQRNLELLTVEPNIQSLRIFRPDGKIIYSSNPVEVNKSIYELTDDILINPRTGSGEQETFVKEGNLYSHHHPIYLQKECLPCHADRESPIAIMDVHVGLSQSEYIYSSSKRLTIISAILIVVILWIILNFLYEGQIESRLQKIISGFKDLALGNLNTNVQMSGRHEIAQLAEEFNQTVNKLKQAKERENQFMQENLERADRLVTLGEVAAEIAHEVNNPASIILSRAEFLKDEMENNPGNGKHIDDMNIIIQQTERIAETTRSILHYARKLPHTFSEMDLNQVIQGSVKILEPRINKVKARVDFRSLITPATIKGNSIQLEQVFCNLINNSLDVLPSGNGQILIEVRASGENSQGYQVIFEDNGPGVPEEIRDHIFAPFYTTKKNGKGTGLGLYIVRNIVSYHQGKVYLSPRNGKGAAFIIELGATNAKD
jgi:signal transduction histidine kinase